MSEVTARRVVRVSLVLSGILALVCLIALSLGAVAIAPQEVLGALARGVVGQANAVTSEQRLILFEIRLPRILLAILVGASLSVAGAAFQALLRNPLADPYVLGVSSGAAVGAILSMIAGQRVTIATPLAAFLGATATIAFVYFLASKAGQLFRHTLLLAGIITASFLSAVIIFLMTMLSGRDLRGIAYWLMGDLSSPTPLDLRWFLLAALAVIVFLYSTAGDLNLLFAGEQEALHLGVNVPRVKTMVYLAASFATGLAVSVSGAIGYVGLLVPHLVRMMFGNDYRLLIPATALGGAILLVAADTLARTLVAPTELPVGAVTALAGAPVFIYLLRRSD